MIGSLHKINLCHIHLISIPYITFSIIYYIKLMNGLITITQGKKNLVFFIHIRALFTHLQ